MVQIQLYGLGAVFYPVRIGDKFARIMLEFSSQIPCLLILALILRSAEQERAIAIGQEPPWRGKRITRISWAKYLPPNCAPMPNSRLALSNSASSAVSRTPGPARSRWWADYRNIWLKPVWRLSASGRRISPQPQKRCDTAGKRLYPVISFFDQERGELFRLQNGFGFLE